MCSTAAPQPLPETFQIRFETGTDSTSSFFQVVDETELRRKTSVIAADVGAKVNLGGRASNVDRLNATSSSMDQVNLSDDENSPARRAPVRGKQFSELPKCHQSQNVFEWINING